MKPIHVDETKCVNSCPIEKSNEKFKEHLQTISSYLLYFPL